MEQILANLAGKTRKETLNGREHIVAPLSLIVPGVLNGSKGPLYYPPEEVSKNPEIWNHVPIVVYHPAIGGQNVSARDPDVLNRQGIGVVLRAKAEGKLVAEGWFDVERTRQIDERILDSLEYGKPIELSTGLYTENEMAEEGANFNGKAYSFVAKNYKPDHLAILPDQVGACSIEDGCGVLVNDKKGPKLTGFVEEKGEHIHSLIVDEFGYGFTNVEHGHSHLVEDFRVKRADGHTHDLIKDNLVDSGIRNSDGKEQPTTTKELVMSKKQKTGIVDSLIDNSCCWGEEDRETLDSFSDEKLALLVENHQMSDSDKKVIDFSKEGFTDPFGNFHVFNEESGQWESEEGEKPESDEQAEEEEKSVDNEKPQTAEEWMKSAPVEIQSAVRNAMEIEQREKDQIVNSLIDGSDSPALEKTLRSKSLQELRVLSELAPKVEEPAANETDSNWLGAASPLSNVAKADSETPSPLPLPSMNWSGK